MPLETLVVYKAWVIAAVFALLFVTERLAPAASAPPAPGRLVTNGAMWLLVLLTSPAIVLPLTVIASEHPLWERPDVPTWLMLIGDVAALDLWAYWLHRAYHEAPLMWRLHSVHHLDERLDSTSAFRFHFAEVALSALLRMAPIVLFAIPLAHVVIFETILLASAIFHHSNLRLPQCVERAISRVIVTPSIHWVHHHAATADTNSNYAAILSLWDPLFRTRSPNRRTPEMRIGVEGRGERPFFRLLVAPFWEPAR
jgi:sterol desaturase/sphingolipid hydroxylase (fatty acid hydroxylase superfamily)